MTMPPSQSPQQQPFSQPPEPRQGSSTTKIVLIICGVLFALLVVCGIGGFFAVRSMGNRVTDTIATASAQMDSTVTAGTFDIESTPEVTDSTDIDSTPTSDEDSAANGQTVAQNSDDTQTVTSSDGNSEVVIPADWSATDTLHEDAEIQVSNPSDEQYLLVLTEEKSDFADTNLQAYGELVRDNLVKNLKNAKVGSTQSLTVNGQPALQYEINGTVDNINITYWLTAVEGKEHFYQVLAWTLQSDADTNQDVLQQVTTSFHETE